MTGTDSHPTKSIAVFCGPNDRFLGDVVTHLATRYRIHRHDGADPEKMADIMAVSDLAWFEWCDQRLIEATRLPNTCPIVCRLHSFEAFTDMPTRVDWSRVSRLLFVAPHIRDILLDQLPDLAGAVTVAILPNGVRLDRFSFRERPKGHRLAYVGHINHKKNPALLLQCLKALVSVDSRYRLHVAGEFQELRTELYWHRMVDVMGLENHIQWSGWVDDMNGWYQDKDFIVSTSLLESFGYGIAEGMACGLKPVIHDFVGADRLYPESYRFATVAQFVDRVCEPDHTPVAYRQYIQNHFDIDFQLRAVDRLVNDLFDTSE